MKGATSIQERLWELRKDKGLNLEELSKLTGISKSALGSYEKEDFKEINHGNLITLADFYGVSVDYLLCRTENREQINTPLPPCMAFPRALTGFPVSSTAKVMYCRMLDAMLSKGQEDENGILFVCFPVTAIAAVLSRSPMTVKRSLNELETAGLIMRVRQGVGEPNRIYVLIPGKEDAALA